MKKTFRKKQTTNPLLTRITYMFLQLWVLSTAISNVLSKYENELTKTNAWKESVVYDMHYETYTKSIANDIYHNSIHSQFRTSCSIWTLRNGKTPKKKTLKRNATHILILTLLLSGDVHPNPGPPILRYNRLDSIYPCPFCEDAVEDGQKGIECEKCKMWYHTSCIGMCTQEYFQHLQNHDKTFNCCRCDYTIHTFGFSTSEIETSNSFEQLNSFVGDFNINDLGFNPRFHSSPRIRQNSPIRSNINNSSKNHNRNTKNRTNNNTQTIITMDENSHNITLRDNSEHTQNNTLPILTSTHTNENTNNGTENRMSDTAHSTINPEDSTNNTTTHNTIHPKGKNFRTLVINANSINGKRADLEYTIKNQDPDVLLITETKLEERDAAISNIIQKMGYKDYRSDFTSDEKGVMIAIKNCYSHDEIKLDDNIESDVNFADHPGIIKWVEMDLKGKKKLYIGVYYRQPNNELEHLKCLEKSLKLIEEKVNNNPNSIVILGGDFNAGFIDWETNTLKTDINDKQISNKRAHEKLLEILKDYPELTQHQMEPTRKDRTLDLFFTNQPNMVQSMQTLAGISDHDIPVADCKLFPSYNKKAPRKVYIYKKANWPKIKEEILTFQEEYMKLYKERSVDANWNDIKRNVTSAMDKHIPAKLTSTRHNLPWMNQTIKRMIKKKQRLYNKAKKTHKGSNWNKYKAIKRDTQKAAKKARTDYINNILLEGIANDNNKPFYSYMKSQKKENIGIAPLQTETGGVTNDSKEKAEILNKQFKDVFTKEKSEELPTMDGPAYPNIRDIKIENKGVEKMLKSLKVNKAPGPDELPAYILKELAEELAPVLTALFNQSLQTGTLPKDWLKANVAPIFKKGDRNSAANYRPVSLTCICCKLLEHIICKHILNHAEEYDILTSLQHGFRNGYSCQTQLLITLQDLMKNRDEHIQTDMVILDFSKAFDTVPHLKLLLKLKHYGIRGNLLDWISNFLQQRDQRVVVDGKCSEWTHVDSGVPQGTVLGPLLFLIYINDMPKCISLGSLIRLFADDCILYRKIRTIQDQLILQKDLDKLKEWADKWGMKFNPSKCEVMRINHARKESKRIERYYTLCNQLLKQVDKTKYLGVIISEDLSWDNHVEYITAKSNRVLGMLRRNIKDCPATLKETAYFSMVRSILEYSCAVWDPHKAKNINNIENVQRRAARFVKNDYRIYLKEEQEYVSVSKMIEDLGWQDLANRRRETRLALFYKIINEQVNVPHNEILKQTSMTQVTRQGKTGKKYIALSCKTDDYKYSFFPRTTRDWNELPNTTVNAPSVEAFKNRLRATVPSEPSAIILP